jgi:BlaI family penicillinase repressor
MRVLWESNPLTANQIVEGLTDDTQWKSRTVKTLINRLVKKGALDFEADGRTYLYSPKVQEKDCIHAESRSFLSRTFSGALMPMLVHFIEGEKLSNEDIDQLTGILEQKRKG